MRSNKAFSDRCECVAQCLQSTVSKYAPQLKHNLGSQSGCAILFAQREQLIASNPLRRRHGGCTNRSAPSGCISPKAPASRCENCLAGAAREMRRARCPSHAHPEYEINPPLRNEPPAKSRAGVAKLLHTQRRRWRPIINSVSAFALLGGTNGADADTQRMMQPCLCSLNNIFG